MYSFRGVYLLCQHSSRCVPSYYCILTILYTWKLERPTTNQWISWFTSLDYFQVMHFHSLIHYNVCRSSGRSMIHKKAKVEFHPLGVVGAIVSWNYPFHNIFNPMLAAVFSGNGIVIKVSSVGLNYYSYFDIVTCYLIFVNLGFRKCKLVWMFLLQNYSSSSCCSWCSRKPGWCNNRVCNLLRFWYSPRSTFYLEL